MIGWIPFIAAILLNMLFLGDVGSAIVGLTGLMAFLAVPKMMSNLCKSVPVAYLVFTFFAVLFAMGGSTVIAVLTLSGLGLGPIVFLTADILLFVGLYVGLMHGVFPRMVQPKL